MGRSIYSSCFQNVSQSIHNGSVTSAIPARGLSKDNLRWILHSRTCMIEELAPRKICHDQRCQELKRIKEHIESCQVGKSCRIPLCVTIAECKEHWESCKDIRCFICKDMRLALIERFFPDLENYPQPIPDNLKLSRESRGERIRTIVRSFYPNADYTDLQDEKLNTAILRARIVEALSYQGATTVEEYDWLNGQEIKDIKGPENL